MNKNNTFRQKSDKEFSFDLKGKEYELNFDGNSPKVFLNGTKQKAKTILRELIQLENIPIQLYGKDKLGKTKEYTTDEIGSKLQKFLGAKKDSIKTLEKKGESFDSNDKSLSKKLKADYNRRSKNGVNGFESYDEFLSWYLELNKECSYCGLSQENSRFIVINGILKSKRFPENGALKRGKARGYYLEVDRKNPEANYSADNCALACYFCNNDKSDVFNSQEYVDFFQNRKSYLEELIKKYNTNRK